MRCKVCNGIGRVPNPEYPTRARVLEDRFDKGYLSYDQYERELGDIFGEKTIPEDSISCPICNGLDIGEVLRSLERITGYKLTPSEHISPRYG